MKQSGEIARGLEGAPKDDSCNSVVLSHLGGYVLVDHIFSYNPTGSDDRSNDPIG